MTIKKILISAILIRLLIIPFFFHPDIKDIHLRVSFLTTDQVLNVYDYLKQKEITKVNAPDFVYPPLAYFFLGGYQFVARPLLGENFQSWLFDFSGLASASPFVFRYLLILKLPYLIFDLAIAYLLFKILDKKDLKLGLLFWFFNPLNLYTIYAIGQFDIIPAFLAFFAWFLWEKRKFGFSGVLLGLGAAFKSFPLLFLPFFWLTQERLKDKLIHSSLALFAYGATVLPFITSEAFQKDVLFSGLSTRIFQLQFPAESGISVFVVFYVSLLLIKLRFKKLSLWTLILTVLLLVFSVSRFHPQWIVWLTPFLTLGIVWSKLNWLHLGLFFSSFFVTFLFFGDKFLVTALLSPVSPLFIEIPPLTQIVSVEMLSLFKFFNQAIFAVLSILIVFRVFSKT